METGLQSFTVVISISAGEFFFGIVSSFIITSYQFPFMTN